MKTGLLLGAGASKDFGLPLATEVTQILKAWLTPQRYWSIETAARARGNGYSDEISHEILSVLGRDEMHFEAILGYFQVQQIRSRSDPKAIPVYSSLYSWFGRVVSEIIFNAHVANIGRLRAIPDEYRRGLRFLVQESRPLWIFSLNYDLVVESLSAAMGIPLESGLPNKDSLIRTDTQGREIGKLAIETISGEQLTESGLVFSKANPVFSSGDHEAIYLIKLHGGLDMFTVHDGKDLIKIAPIGTGAVQIIGNLVILREEVALTRSSDPAAVFPIDEYLYKDENGTLRFLRHSIVAGAFKFDPKYPQILLSRLLDSFKAFIRYVSNLVVVGYSFGDVHVNLVIREWIEMNKDRRIEIVDPYINGVPGFLSHVAPQVRVTPKTALEYFGLIAEIDGADS